MYIGDIIRQYRDEHHISLRAFAEKCNGISHGYLATLESGKNSNTGKPSTPSIDKLEAIAHGMDITVDNLFAMMNDEPFIVSSHVSYDNPYQPPTASPSMNQRIADLIESEVQSRVEEQMRGKTDAITDPDDWIPLAPGYEDWPEEIRRSFQTAISSVWNSFDNIAKHQRKDEDE